MFVGQKVYRNVKLKLSFYFLDNSYKIKLLQLDVFSKFSQACLEVVTHGTLSISR